MKRIMTFFMVIFFGVLGLCWAKDDAMRLISPAFKHGDIIPRKYTCDGDDISPPLRWDKVPDKTKSFALICDDPDAPMGTWVHWVYYNIPKNIRNLPEGIVSNENPYIGGTQGLNDFKRIGYGGPCPPGGKHRYFFRLYALDDVLDLPAGLTKAQLLKRIETHIIETAVLMGIYSR